MKRSLLALFLLVLCSLPASAATCYWVGGTATWSSANAASWASSTGGTASTCAATGGVPGSTGPDTAIFDGSSGGGTVTVNLNANLNNITSSAFTGTLDFSVNTNTFTISSTSTAWGDAGTGTHTIKLGADTFNITCAGGNFANCWAFSGSGTTLTAGTSTLNFTQTGTCNGSSRAGTGSYNFNSKTYANVTITGAACTYAVNGNNIFTSLTLTGPVSLNFGISQQTIGSAFTWTGSSGNEISLLCLGNGFCSISAASGSSGTWIALTNVAFTSNTPTFTNCVGNNNTGVSCTAPNVVSGGGGGIIGGGM